ncbi:MAG: hypothetical protein DLM67_12890 [Candidatus Nephthysia bennettiae]|uniref:Thymidylate kinase-like domain-containing protein n=1 Tax=Candidatus Nephthysia bennettiae TaxID=3127016 RepID=A0A934N848_9BACT|nr:hypothetical protein [Candidatus Dormibacteraeota bacterium]MBJ7611613.1 hypothetical protein [Candidatus Dormibacteraeota bacterium]PZR94099.1 MAG: hypothetical protein DLM67_12890 [Candidatus Dormibacteraeota bacterium]
MAGVLITFEGPEGAGKSTQVEQLRGRLADRDVEAHREPGSTEQNAGATGFPPGPLPQSGGWESLGSDNSDGRSESGLSSGASVSSLPLAGRVGRGSL